MVHGKNIEGDALSLEQFKYIMHTFDFNDMSLQESLPQGLFELEFEHRQLGFNVQIHPGTQMVEVNAIQDPSLESTLLPNDTLLAVNGAPLVMSQGTSQWVSRASYSGSSPLFLLILCFVLCVHLSLSFKRAFSSTCHRSSAPSKSPLSESRVIKSESGQRGGWLRWASNQRPSSGMR